MCSDADVLKAVELILLFILFLSMLMELVIWIKKKRRRGGSSVTVKRGDHSMNFLYIMYGTATIIFALSVQVSEAFKGYKVSLVVFNYFALTYLFFFNSWLRNRILFPIMLRIEKD